MSEPDIYFLNMFVYFHYVFLDVLVMSSIDYKFLHLLTQHFDLVFEFHIFDLAFLQSFADWLCDIFNQLHHFAHPHEFFVSVLQCTVLFKLLLFRNRSEAFCDLLILCLRLQMVKSILLTWLLSDRLKSLLESFVQFIGCAELCEGLLQLLIMVFIEFDNWTRVGQRALSFLLNFFLLLLLFLQTFLQQLLICFVFLI